jgi:hypothetical protein
LHRREYSDADKGESVWWQDGFPERGGISNRKTRKTTLPWKQKTPQRRGVLAEAGVGFEPTTVRICKPYQKKRKCEEKQALTKSTNPDLVGFLAFLKSETPDLASVVESWNTLPEAVRAGILAMVKASAKG